MLIMRPRPTYLFIAVLFAVVLIFLLIYQRPSYTLRWSSLTPGSDDTNPAPEWHYGVMMDAGSSGSRLHIYTWPTHSGDASHLLDMRPLRDKGGRPLVMRKSPGLSSLASNPKRTAEYIEQFLAFAAQHVPAAKHPETPLYIMATAGMRMIPEIAQKKILEELRQYVRLNYHFLFNDRHVEIITGKQEGVFAWIATNYLLGRFSHNHTDSAPVVAVPSSIHDHLHFRKRTVGVIDMGGGSIQIAFEVPVTGTVALPDDLAAEFNLGCMKGDEGHTYRIYVSTFLGYGVNAARKRWERDLIQRHTDARHTTTTTPLTTHPASSTAPTVGNHTKNESTIETDQLAATPTSTMLNTSPAGIFLSDPCLPVGLQFPQLHADITLRGSGDLQQCVQGLRDRLLRLDKPCTLLPCSMSGVHQPVLDFLHTEFYGFSEFWYTSNDIFNLGGQYRQRRFLQASKRFCGSGWPDLLSRFMKGKFRSEVTLDRLKLQCFKAAWIMTVLHYGLHFPTSYRNFNSVIKIGGTEAQWTLGALLFRTRYFPLREVQRKELQLLKRRRARRLTGSYQYLLLAGAVVCVAFALIHIHRLRISLWS